MSTCLPVEIIDNIVETAISASPQPSVLNALALVAHACRHTVNATRFRSLDLFLNIAPQGTRLLADVFSSESTVWPEQEKAAQHVRILRLTFRPYASPDPHTSSRDLIDESSEVHVITIFDSILHAHPPATKGLLINIRAPSELSVNGWSITHTYSLATLGPQTRVALLNLCSSTDVDTLELDNLTDVPSALVLSTGAATLNVSGVRFTPETPPLSDFPFRNIRRLSVGSSPSFLDILRKLHDRPLPALERLELGLNGSYVRQTDFTAWSRFTTNTTELHIEVMEYVTSIPGRWRYSPRSRTQTQREISTYPQAHSTAQPAQPCSTSTSLSHSTLVTASPTRSRTLR